MICPFCGAEVGNAIICPQCGATVATPSISVSLSLPLGTKLFGGKYSVGKVLGQGGFGITYMGADTVLSRPVAIKELFPEGCQRNGTTVQPTRIPPSDFSSMKQRFLDEARLLASLNHPGIVKVYDFFEENNTAYMVMEYLRGKSLAKLVEERGGALSEQEAVGYILKVCEALDVVHKAGYLHRDIKPDNIIVCGDGRVVLVDFGAARSFMAGRTGRMTVILTPGFAPLEQYAEQAKRGAYTDIYALGATLYYLLTGQVPVSAADRFSGVELRGVREINGRVSRQVEEAVMKAMAMRVEERPQSVKEFVKLLTAPSRTLVVASDGSGDFRDLEEAVQKAQSGTTIHLKAGIYRLKRPLVIDKPLTLIGEGMETTRIVCDGEECVVKFSGDGLFSARDIAFVHEGNRWANVVTADRGEVSFIRCLFTGGVWDEAIKRGGDGLWLFGMVGGRIEACQAIGNDLHGIEVSGLARPTLEGNTCRENKEDGIAYFENSAGVARQNICIGNGLHGIGVSGQAQPTLEGNTCRENKRCGIACLGNSAGVARQNICIGNRHGIYVGGQAQPTLEGNTCRENKECGIAYFGNSAGVARQNICIGNEYGIYVGDQAQPTLEGNTCRENDGGIAYFDNSAGVARQNICIGNRHGIYVGGQAQPTLEGNTCRENKECGIAYFDNSAGVARQNICADNAIDDIYVSPTAQPILKDNRWW
jgi:parallel beta-helix repeat protein